TEHEPDERVGARRHLRGSYPIAHPARSPSGSIRADSRALRWGYRGAARRRGGVARNGYDSLDHADPALPKSRRWGLSSVRAALILPVSRDTLSPMIDLRRIQTSIQLSFLVSNWRVLVLLLAGCLLGGAAVGIAVAAFSPVVALALMVGAGAGLLMLRSVQWALYATIAVAILLPFAALPINVG